MSNVVHLARSLARLRTSVLTLLPFLISCGPNDILTENQAVVNPPAEVPVLSVEFAGGIPFGLYALPTNQFGTTYNGASKNARVLARSGTFLSTLAAIKSRGGRVLLQLSGNHRHYLDSQGHFSFTKWKARVDTFRLYNFSSYITDGTIIGHFMIDEPNDASNFGGQAVPGTMVEAMAKYSKSIWPKMATVTRAESTYLLRWPGYTYLDAAWAQYVYRKGDVGPFIRRNIADAQKLGLALITGLNIKRGGPNGATMTPSQIKTWGSTLLSSSYPCAFISWQWDPNYYALAGVKDAMKYLRSKAQNRVSKTCRS
jgi:hypothetical protein